MVNGMNTATAAVLLIKADIKPTVEEIKITEKFAPRPNNLINGFEMSVIVPDLTKAALIISMHATVIVASLLKPRTASLGLMTPETTSKDIIKRAVKSLRKISLKKKNAPPTKIIRVDNSLWFAKISFILSSYRLCIEYQYETCIYIRKVIRLFKHLNYTIIVIIQC